MTQDLYDDVEFLIPSFEPLYMDYQCLQFVWTPMGTLVCPHTHLGAPHVYYLQNKGSTPCPLILWVLFHIMACMDFIRPPLRPNEMYYWSFNLLRGLLFWFWASLVGLSPKHCYFTHYLILGAQFGLIRKIKFIWTCINTSDMIHFIIITWFWTCISLDNFVILMGERNFGAWNEFWCLDYFSHILELLDWKFFGWMDILLYM